MNIYYFSRILIILGQSLSLNYKLLSSNFSVDIYADHESNIYSFLCKFMFRDFQHIIRFCLRIMRVLCLPELASIGDCVRGILRSFCRCSRRVAEQMSFLKHFTILFDLFSWSQSTEGYLGNGTLRIMIVVSICLGFSGLLGSLALFCIKMKKHQIRDLHLGKLVVKCFIKIQCKRKLD